MSDLVWKRGDMHMLAFGQKIDCSCNVRNLENGWRQRDQVVFSTNADGSMGVPYSPQLFPVGLWKVGRPEVEIDPYLRPFFIPTNAHQLVERWHIAERDKLVYVSGTGELVEDWAYGLHNSTSPTTLGCIRISLFYELRRLVDDINKALDEGHDVTMEILA